MTEIDINELDFKEITQEEFNIGGGRSGSHWNSEAIQQFATHLGKECAGKKIEISIGKFYTSMREDKGEEVVKYASYYSRKVLLEAFETLGIKAKVKTMGTKNNSTEGVLKISVIGY